MKSTSAIGRTQTCLFLDKAFVGDRLRRQSCLIGEGQTTSHPYTAAYQTQITDIQQEMQDFRDRYRFLGHWCSGTGRNGSDGLHRTVKACMTETKPILMS